ncbi:SRPBCC family protein [Mycolicibacterium gadium]|uniref:SRPBCC family protein n=1 Tax=Mycolicibacterium gadium TaxID=1794 RepID=A0ABT6GJN5_MYCGU|nr:SRPBCC family protein [Mycolicibacterium gadium]MDG5481583.1 SRPBCC family protein [Mycolicibacterium gadium]
MIMNGLRLAGATALLYAARRYYRNWGTTKEECQMFLDGDELIAGPVVRSTEAVSIDGPLAAVWPWLVQMGQDRGGLYTFEKLENFAGLRYVNADRIHPEWQHLAPGDTVRLVPKGWMGLRDGFVLKVEEVVDQQSIVLSASVRRQWNREWNVVWSFHVIPHWDDRCRLLVRIRSPLRRPGQVLVTELAGPATAFVTRGILLGIKRRVQQQVQAEAAAAKASNDLHRVI